MNNTKDVYCRLCAELKPHNKLTNLQKDEEMCENIISKLTRFNIQMDFNENILPKTVCLLCIKSLDRAFTFVSAVEQAQAALCDFILIQPHTGESNMNDKNIFYESPDEGKELPTINIKDEDNFNEPMDVSMSNVEIKSILQSPNLHSEDRINVKDENISPELNYDDTSAGEEDNDDQIANESNDLNNKDNNNYDMSVSNDENIFDESPDEGKELPIINIKDEENFNEPTDVSMSNVDIKSILQSPNLHSEDRINVTDENVNYESPEINYDDNSASEESNNDKIAHKSNDLNKEDTYNYDMNGNNEENINNKVNTPLKHPDAQDENKKRKLKNLKQKTKSKSKDSNSESLDNEENSIVKGKLKNLKQKPKTKSKSKDSNSESQYNKENSTDLIIKEINKLDKGKLKNLKQKTKTKSKSKDSNPESLENEENSTDLINKETNKLEKGKLKNLTQKTKTKSKSKDSNSESLESEENSTDFINEEINRLAPVSIQHIKMTWADFCWKCSLCETQFSNVHELRNHAMQYHNTCNPYTCPDCNTYKLRLDGFVKHVRIHRKYLHYSCYMCDMKFSKPFWTHKHLFKHKDTEHMCLGCSTYFESKHELEKHVTTFYKNMWKKKIPEKLPQDDFTCTLCNKSYKTAGAIRYHLASHTGTKEHVCEICGKAFSRKEYLRDHKIVHSGSDVKLYPCEICKHSFKNIYQLRYHVNVHSGIKPFTCDECGKCFRLKRQLANHLAIHTESLPFVCTYCNKRFRVKSNLKSHMHQHTGVKPYSCDICQRDFTNWSNWNKHMNRKHGMEMAKKKRTPQGPHAVDRATGKIIYPEPDRMLEWKKKMKEPLQSKSELIKKTEKVVIHQDKLVVTSVMGTSVCEPPTQITKQI